MDSGLVLLKDELYQYHIARGAADDAEQRIAFPTMQANHDRASDTLGDAVRGGKRGYSAQAIDHQHTHNGER